MLRLALVLASLAVLVVPVAGCHQPVARAQAVTCSDVTMGGWSGQAHCAALARRVIPGADRACVTDADCVLVHPGAPCRNATVSASRIDAYRDMPASCVHPAGGPCPPATPYCDGGCCLAR
jgi:hypothetical protein